MICGPCKQAIHSRCAGKTWCDCQHRDEALVPVEGRLPVGSLHDLQYGQNMVGLNPQP